VTVRRQWVPLSASHAVWNRFDGPPLDPLTGPLDVFHGTNFQLPPFQQRLSFARDLSTRRLLTPGKRETFDFTSRVLFSRRMGQGSRIVVVIGPIKGPGQQINYGSGKEVNDETIQDAGAPLELRILPGSSIALPVRRR